LIAVSDESTPSSTKGEIRMKKLFVGNLSFSATEQSVRSLFEAHGTVDSVSIVTDRDTGQPRGFGFVEMPNDSEAEQAIAALNGTDLGGRTLNVNEARPKPERGFGGGGSRGGGGGRGGSRGGGYGRERSRW
jgi:RNA recognition motif-containing protein